MKHLPTPRALSSLAAVTALAALVAFGGASAAQATTQYPVGYATYYCWYSNPAGDGASVFQIPTGLSLLRGIENYTFNGVSDNRRVTFAKPTALPNEPDCTKWEYTQNPSGPQCKNTRVCYGGWSIEFDQCTDGHRRTCYLY